MAAPCADCGTTGGYIHPRRPGHPTRERRLCSRCADWHKYHGTIERFPLVDQRHNALPNIPVGPTSASERGHVVAGVPGLVTVEMTSAERQSHLNHIAALGGNRYARFAQPIDVINATIPA